MWRRLIVVPFTFTPENDQEVDTTLRSKLQKELPGILNWALAGLKRLLKQDGFTACEVCTAAAMNHRRECSPADEFIDNHFSFAADHPQPLGFDWKTCSTEIKKLVKEEAIKFGEKGIAANIICRVLAKRPGVKKDRPSTMKERSEKGSTIYIGVCLGEPKAIVNAGQADIPLDDEDEEGDLPLDDEDDPPLDDDDSEDDPQPVEDADDDVTPISDEDEDDPPPDDDEKDDDPPPKKAKPKSKHSG